MTRTLLITGLLLCAAAAMAQQRGAMFDNADSNGDGAISREEFLAARASQFSKRDLNGDGYIDAADVPAQAANRPALADAMARARRSMDTSGDGKLSKEEFLNGGLSAFKRADTDGNDSLDAKEVEAAKSALRAKPAAR